VTVGNIGQACSNITQEVEVIKEDDKLIRLLEVLGENYAKGPILIFVDKQVFADNLFKDLFQAGYKVLVSHGG
jgi:ATP-dependent RNA helicase DDX46/PRP5